MENQLAPEVKHIHLVARESVIPESIYIYRSENIVVAVIVWCKGRGDHKLTTAGLKGYLGALARSAALICRRHGIPACLGYSISWFGRAILPGIGRLRETCIQYQGTPL